MASSIKEDNLDEYEEEVEEVENSKKSWIVYRSFKEEEGVDWEIELEDNENC